MPKDLPNTEGDIVTLAPAATEVGALALITLNPETYVAEVFKPFRTKLDALKEEAALIHFKDDRLYDAPHKYVDISTVAGMDIAIKYRAAFRDDVRIAAEKTRVQRKAPMLAIGKLLDSEYKAIETDAAPFESHFDTAIREENSRKEAIKAAKELAEAERIAAIRIKIAEITGLLVANAGATSDELTAALQTLAKREIEKEEFAELTDEARTAVEYAAVELMTLRDTAATREKAEADRLAEVAAEKKRNAEQAEANRLAAIENERIANEQAAERRRLADQQAAQERAAKELAEKAAANLRAEREAQELAMRLEREKAAKEQAERDRVAADLKRQLDEQQAAIAAERAALVREQEESAARVAAAAKLEADHAEALIDNATFDDAMTRLAAVDTPTFHVEPSDDLARCNATIAALRADNLPRPESCCARDARIDSGDDAEVTDDEITEMGAEWGLDKPALIVRLRKYIADSEAA